MKYVITGAGGFIGKALTQRLLAETEADLTLFDRHFGHDALYRDDRITLVQGKLQDGAARSRMLGDSFTTLFHLAALPGGAAEKDPTLSKVINLEATLALFEEAAATQPQARIVFTSTIAVLGGRMPAQVDDSCPVAPAMIYGTHKAMMELALADMARRNLLDPVAVRLPGILARPPSASGMKSAFLSDVFHALDAGQPFICPVSPAATMWLMSADQAAINLHHGAVLDSRDMPASRVVTLPAVRCSMAELVACIAEATGSSATLVSYAPDADLEANFGAQPPLSTPAALHAGFNSDGALATLVERALARIRTDRNG
ncbi:MAG: NAD-dependent epimerase/dehydratase family protein [Gammaproteobacteria bacterium]|nr:NAD-dependent epimerase/dehydratase family protein [Gammaproteobacteria bacterium]